MNIYYKWIKIYFLIEGRILQGTTGVCFVLIGERIYAVWVHTRSQTTYDYISVKFWHASCEENAAYMMLNSTAIT